MILYGIALSKLIICISIVDQDNAAKWIPGSVKRLNIYYKIMDVTSLGTIKM